MPPLGVSRVGRRLTIGIPHLGTAGSRTTEKEALGVSKVVLLQQDMCAEIIAPRYSH